jgi:hypothetical protein
MNEYHDKPGLHVITLYAQTHELTEIDELVTKHNIKYPVAFDIAWSSGYQTPNMPLPKMWLIGTDGKVKFAGFAGYSKVLEEELAKVKYPGLGKDSVAEALKPAAEAFVKGKYAEAYKAAEAIYDSTEVAAEEDDADWIIKRIEGRAEDLRMRAETAEIEKQIGTAIRCWEALTKFEGISEAEGAAKRLAKLKASDEAKREMASRKQLLSEMLKLNLYYATIDAEKAEDVRTFREKCVEVYKKFAADHEGTGGATRANELAQTFTDLLKADAPEDKPDEEPAKEPANEPAKEPAKKE